MFMSGFAKPGSKRHKLHDFMRQCVITFTSCKTYNVTIKGRDTSITKEEKMSNRETALGQSIKIGNKIARNRFVIQPMEGADGNPDGSFSDKTIARYSNLFAGDAGLIDFEAVTLQKDFIARTNQITLDVHDSESVKRWEEFIRQMKDINPDPLLIIQLTHSGEISGGGDKRRLCPNPLPGFEGELMTDEQADEVIETWAEAAHVLHECGADGVDLKFCHGYLGSQILRPYNNRNWKYGGSWEKRSSWAFNMIDAVRKAVNDPDFLLGSKISMWEGIPGGQGSAGPDTPVIDLTESIDLCKGLVERGASYILESTGTPVHTCALHMPDRRFPTDAYLHMTMAKIIKDNVPKETCVIGGAYSVLNNGKNKLHAVNKDWNSLIHWGNYNIEHGYCDMIALGRQSLADPKLPAKYLTDREDEINWCVACDSCAELLTQQENVGCVVYNKPYAEILKECRRKKGRVTETHIGG